MTAVVMQAGAAAALLPAAGWGGVLVLPTASRRRLTRTDAASAADVVSDVLQAAGRAAIVLARPPEADADAARLWQLAGLHSLGRVRLPAEPPASAWVAGLAAAWIAAGEEGLLRRLQVAAALATGRASEPAARVRPSVLARWAGHVWRRCRWCEGGGLALRCGTCGAASVVVP